MLGDASRAVRRRRRSSSSGTNVGGQTGPSGFSLAFLAPYPYYEGSEGCTLDEEVIEDDPGLAGRHMAVRVAGEGGYLLAGAGRAGLALRLSMPELVDLSARYSMFIEPQPGGTDTAYLGRVAVALRVLEDTYLRFRLGVGLRHWHDAIGSLFGGSFFIAADVFPFEPLVLSFEAGVGLVGEAFLPLGRATLGVMIEHVEIFAGYHAVGLLSEGGDPVDLGGPMAGVRVWL